MTKESHDWTRFIKKQFVRSPRDKVFRMWINPSEIIKFWILGAKYFTPDGRERNESESAQTGDKYEWDFISGLVMKGKIIEVRQNELFKFTFGTRYAGSDEPIIVTIKFIEDGENTWIEIVQENIGEDERGKVYYYVSCSLGWSFALTNFKSYIEFGNDLRDKEVYRAKNERGIVIPELSVPY